jgi:sulfate adenylyltransferase subunit 2
MQDVLRDERWNPENARLRASATILGVNYQISHLETLEAESIHIIREAVAESERPVLLFSGGKDSALLLRLAVKAFYPARLPFPVMHVDTGHNFPEVLAFRNKTVEELGVDLIVASVQEAIDQGRVAEQTGPNASRNTLQIEPLLAAIEHHRFDMVFGGARRDEEKARAKERIFSFRDEFSQWDPKNQRPELWSLYNARHNHGEHIRAFPISNWTEMDVWQYIGKETLDLPSVYFTHRRKVFARDGLLMADSDYIIRGDDEEVFEADVRFRTVGDMSCTGAFASTASTVDEIIVEVSTTRITERGASRADDRTSEAAMEDRKREGYF